MTDTNSTSEISGDSFDDDESENGFATSSECSDSTDDNAPRAEQDTLELAKFANETIKLPRGLCENAEIFREFFSMDTWQLLSENFKTYLLCKHFPTFPDSAEDQIEKDKTVHMLFNNQIDRFGKSPLMEIQRNLEEGNYRPDVLKLRQSIAKSQKRERRFQSCERISQMARQLFISRERLLRNAYRGDIMENIKINRAPKRQHSLMQLDSSMSAMRANKRFLTEIKYISRQCNVENFTDEDNDLEVQSIDEAQKDSRLCNSLEESNATPRANPTSEKCIYSTQFKRSQVTNDEDAARLQFESKQKRLSNRTFKQYLLEHKRRKIIEPNLPDFETLDIRLRDVYARAQVGGNFKCVFASNKTPGRKPKSKLKSLISSSLPTLCNNNINNKVDKGASREKSWVTGIAQNDTSVNKYERKCGLTDSSTKISNQEEAQESVFLRSDSTTEVKIPENNDNIIGSKRVIPTFITSNELLRKENRQNKIENVWKDDEISSNRNEINREIKEQLKPVHNKSGALFSTSDVKNEVLASNLLYSDVSNVIKNNSLSDIGTPLTNDNPSNPHSRDTIVDETIAPLSCPALIQETHACFFSLIRDFFCATSNHRMKLDQLRQKVCVWIQNPITALNDWYTQAENWFALLLSAIKFLAGEFSEQPDEYVPYIEHKPQEGIYQWIGAGRDSDARLVELSQFWLSHRNKLLEKLPINQRFESDLNSTTMPRRHSTEFEDTNASERGISPPPPPRCPTSWTVTAATATEVAEFQRQERERFENPHRAYTYRMHGYESVVGPVKGIYSQILALTKARGHSMMIGDRPNFVTILTLVRDATARLPNGEGTRADISELLKCSQYINRDAAENVLQTIVSGALDRMHTEHDPCVRYDPKRKIWIYLHRNRSEEEFEQMHQQYQGLGKHKKPTNRRTKAKNVKDTVESDFISSSTIAKTAKPGISTSGSTSNNVVNSLPALVPANPIIVNATLNQNIKTQQQQMTKFPPVPPLKYNVQPNQQKSLLKTTVQPTRSIDPPTANTNSLQTDFGSVRYFKNVQNISMDTPALVGPLSQSTASVGGESIVPNKMLNSSSKSVTKLSSVVTSNTTPIIVATPSGLKTVHVSNATSVSTSSSSPSVHFIRSDSRQTSNTSSLSAMVGGKKVALNKPIIINQITQQTTQKNSKGQTMFRQLSQQEKQRLQQQHSINVASGQPKTFVENDKQTSTKESKSIQTIFGDKTRLVSQDIQSNSTKNVVRILSSSSNKEINKSVIALPISAPKQQLAQIAGQPLLTATVRPQSIQKKIDSGISLIAANSNISSPSSLPTNTIVRMSPQAFASLQKKQSQQQHILVKSLSSQQQPQKQQRVVIGKSANSVHSSVASPKKNVILQQVSGDLVSPNKVNIGQSCVLNIATKTSSQQIHSSNKIQTINASNIVTQQQQNVILQNIKQQQQPVQFKTVQVLSNATTVQQQQLAPVGSAGGGAHMLRTVTVNSIAPLLKANAQLTPTKTAIDSQGQNVSCVLKAAQTSKESIKTSSASDVTTATGQIISLEDLIAKQGGTLRISNATSTSTKVVGQGNNIIQLIPSNVHQEGTQYATVMPSHSPNIITLRSPQIHSSQAPTSTTVFSAPIALSVGEAKDTTTDKYITSPAKIVQVTGQSQPHTQSNISAARVTSTNLFEKSIPGTISTSSNTVGTSGSIKIISTGGVPTSNFNIANIQGKQVILANKKMSSGTVLGTTQINRAQKAQNQTIILGGQTTACRVPGNNNLKMISKGATLTSKGNAQPLHTVLVGNQIIRVDQLPASVRQQIQQTSRSTVATSTLPLTTVSSNNTGTIVVSNNEIIKHPLSVPNPHASTAFLLGPSGQRIRLQTSPNTSQQSVSNSSVTNKNIIVANAQKNTTAKPPASRVVLAVQGSGQIIFSSPNYQSGAVNLKSLQNVKVVTVSQANSLPSHGIQQVERMPKASQQHLIQQQLISRSGSGSGNGIEES